MQPAHVICDSQRLPNNRDLQLHGLGKLTSFDRPDAARIGRQAIEGQGANLLETRGRDVLSDRAIEVS